jgi:hypothetical protein
MPLIINKYWRIAFCVKKLERPISFCVKKLERIEMCEEVGEECHYCCC